MVLVVLLHRLSGATWKTQIAADSAAGGNFDE